jgi:hypothetical protein
MYICPAWHNAGTFGQHGGMQAFLASMAECLFLWPACPISCTFAMLARITARCHTTEQDLAILANLFGHPRQVVATLWPSCPDTMLTCFAFMVTCLNKDIGIVGHHGEDMQNAGFVDRRYG